MFSNEDFERLLVKYTSQGIPAGESIQHFCDRNKVPYSNSVPRPPVTSEFLDAMSETELKNVILDLFDQVREMNARLAEKGRAMAEKDIVIATLTEKLDAVLGKQRQQKLDLESWLTKERQWKMEREGFRKTIKNLNDIINALKG